MDNFKVSYRQTCFWIDDAKSKSRDFPWTGSRRVNTEIQGILDNVLYALHKLHSASRTKSRHGRPNVQVHRAVVLAIRVVLKLRLLAGIIERCGVDRSQHSRVRSRGVQDEKKYRRK